MERNRRTMKYQSPASTDSVKAPPAQPAGAPETPVPTKKRNPSAHYAQGFRPDPAPKQPPSRKKGARRKALYIAVSAVLLCVFVYASYQVIEYLIQAKVLQIKINA